MERLDRWETEVAAMGRPFPTGATGIVPGIAREIVAGTRGNFPGLQVSLAVPGSRQRLPQREAPADREGARGEYG